jgi:hypothetical protein
MGKSRSKKSTSYINIPMPAPLRLLLWLFLIMPARALLAADTSSACKVIGGDGGPDFACGPQPPLKLPECTGFKLGQHTPGVEDFSRILLGEYHGDKEREKTAACVDQLTKQHKRHRVYLEGVEAGKIVPCGKHGIPKKSGRECMGWDDMDEFAKIASSDVVVQLYLKHIKKQFDKQNPPDHLFEALLQQNIQRFKGVVDQEGNVKAMQLLLNEAKRGKDYKDAFSQLIKADIKNMSTEAGNFKKSHKKRNRALMKTLGENPNGLFAIVVAGKRHLQKLEDIDPADAAYVQRELRRGEDANPYAILAMVK